MLVLINYANLALHFHWGKNNSVGSEHTIDNVRYPLEVGLIKLKLNSKRKRN